MAHGTCHMHHAPCPCICPKQVLIFPDIRVLGTVPKGGTATTVYGGQAAVPCADMLVAGTSCKDFSGLKGKDRKSIEALGTSGQTFFGFVELLLEQVGRPPCTCTWAHAHAHDTCP